MFYGLNNFIKKIFPKRLFYRALIIVAAPVIILQITISIVFFDSIWIKANKGMTRSLVSEIETLFDVYKSNQTRENIKQITDLYKKNFDFVINIKKNEKLPVTKSDRRFSPMDRSLRREMKPVFGNQYWFDTVTYIDLVDLNNMGDYGTIDEFGIGKKTIAIRRPTATYLNLQEDLRLFHRKEMKRLLFQDLWHKKKVHNAIQMVYEPLCKVHIDCIHPKVLL